MEQQIIRIGPKPACYGLTQFEWDDDRDMREYSVWICDQIHGVPAWTPLYFWSWCDGISNSIQYACETLSIPESKGYDSRAIDGYYYLAVIEPKEQEVGQRQQAFRQNIIPFIEDFEGEWHKGVDEWMAAIKPFKEHDLGQATNIQLWDRFEQFLWVVHRGWWRIHMYYLFAIYSIYMLFEDICRELLGIEPGDALSKRLVQGFDNMMFRVNKELWHLGDRAGELGLAQMFLTTTDDEEVLRKLEEIQAGREWLQQYHEFLGVHGWRTVRMLDWTTPSWIEKPSLGIGDIRRGIAKGGAFVLDEERERLVGDRREAENEALSRVPAEQKEWFEKLMRVAQQCGVFSEEHNYYLDLQANALGRHITKEYAQRFAQAGVIDEPDDLYMLMPQEIRKASIPLERIDLRRYVEMRREEWKKNLNIQPSPLIGNMALLGEVARKDPTIRVQAAPPVVRPELKADLYGAGSAPGVVEGIAHVVMAEAELKELKPGEILVAPTTMAPWTPVFGIVAGVVTDAGGSLAHAVIVGREYGIPTITGTQEATRKIRTGMKVRVDGNNLAVYILSE